MKKLVNEENDTYIFSFVWWHLFDQAHEFVSTFFYIIQTEGWENTGRTYQTGLLVGFYSETEIQFHLNWHRE